MLELCLVNRDAHCDWQVETGSALNLTSCRSADPFHQAHALNRQFRRQRGSGEIGINLAQQHLGNSARRGIAMVFQATACGLHQTVHARYRLWPKR